MTEKTPIYTKNIDIIIGCTLLLLLVVLFPSLIVFLLIENNVIKTSDQPYWIYVSRFILATSGTLLMLLIHPQIFMMTYASFQLIINKYQPDIKLEEDTSKPRLQTLSGCYRFLHIHYPWVDITGERYRDSYFPIRFLSSLYGVFIIGILQNLNGFLSYFMSITIAWPTVPLINDGLYLPLQYVGMGLGIGVDVIVNVLKAKYSHYEKKRKINELSDTEERA